LFIAESPQPCCLPPARMPDAARCDGNEQESCTAAARGGTSDFPRCPGSQQALARDEVSTLIVLVAGRGPLSHSSGMESADAATGGYRIGYGRVSSRDQNLDSQRDALEAAGCDEIHIDKASGKLASRPEFDKALGRLRPGDTFVITRLSRAMRSLRHLIGLSGDLTERGVHLQVLKQGIDTTTAQGRLVFHGLGAIDEFQRELIVEGTLEGLASSRPPAGGREDVPQL
jgi:hypothetical protein